MSAEVFEGEKRGEPTIPAAGAEGAATATVSPRSESSDTNAEEERIKLPNPEREERRGPFDYPLPDDVFDTLLPRNKATLRRMTPIRGLPVQEFDPVVQKALDELKDDYKTRGGNDARRELSEQYLDDVEAVTVRLNKQALPRTTRLLLSVEGVYEMLLLDAIGKKGIGLERRDRTGRGGRGPEDAGGYPAQAVVRREGNA